MAFVLIEPGHVTEIWINFRKSGFHRISAIIDHSMWRRDAPGGWALLRRVP